MRILVTGATGVIGRAAVSELLRRGHTVRILSRHADRDVDAWGGSVEPFVADVADASAVRGAAAGCGAVIHVVGILEESPPLVTFERINVGGTRNMVGEAERAGVRRFVFISSLGAERGHTGYHRSKRAAERLVERFPHDWTILRTGNVIGPGDQATSRVLRMIRTLPVIPVVARGEHPFQPIWHEDLAWAIAEIVGRSDLAGRTLDLAGPELITVDDLVDHFAELTGRSRPRLPMPAPLARLAARIGVALGIDGVIHPDTITMLVEGSVIPEGGTNALTDILGRETVPIRQRLAQLVDTLPEQTPEQGVGRLERRRFEVQIVNAQCTARQLFERFRTRFDDFIALDAEAEPDSMSRLDVGRTVTIALPPRGHSQVRVEEVGDGFITLGTVEGHPLAGVIRFAFEDDGPGAIHFSIDIAERPATRLDQITMAVLGRRAQRLAWTDTARRVIEASGGHAPDGVRQSEWTLDGPAAGKVEDWVRRRIHRRMRHRQAGTRPPPPESAGAKPGPTTRRR